MKIALASPPHPKTIDDGLYWVRKLIEDAAAEQAEIICFPESYLPGYPDQKHNTKRCTPEMLQAALSSVCEMAAENAIAVILPMDWYESDTLLNLAYVISKSGKVLGYQTKNQLDPSEDTIWAPGTERSVFEVNGVKFGITICHEGFRYPESVRWAARQGAKIVFHPHCCGSDLHGTQLTEWGSKSNPYYEKAQMLRAMENTIYFAGVNYAFKYAESASALIDPEGNCITYQPYGKVGVVTAEIDTERATALLAGRFKPELYSWH